MINFVQTIVATKPIEKIESSLKWKCIYDSKNDSGFGNKPCVQFWICEQDLKESFEDYAYETFGDAIQQIIRMGENPSFYDLSRRKHVPLSTAPTF